MNSTVHTHTPTHAQWLSFTSAVIHRLQWLETWWIFIDYPDYCELSSVCICRASCLKTVIHFLQSVNSSAPVRRPDANVLTMCLSYLVCWSAQLRSLMLVKSYLDVHKTHTHTIKIINNEIHSLNPHSSCSVHTAFKLTLLKILKFQ